MAIFYSNNELIELLVRRGVDINSKGKNGVTPLFYAVVNLWVKTQAVQCLLNNGADMNMRLANGKAPLDLAKEMNRPDVVSLFEHAMSGGRKG